MVSGISQQLNMVSEIEVNGVKRGFRFGTYTFAVATKEENCSITQLYERLGEGNLTAILNFLYAAAVSYQKHKKLPVDFDAVDVSDWLDVIGLEKSTNLITEGLKQPKNDLPPEKEGAK